MISDQDLYRIVVVDDDPAIMGSYRSTLDSLVTRDDPGSDSDTDDLARDLFGEESVEPDTGDKQILDEVVYCTQGTDGVAAIERSIASGTPCAIAFLDMRMPPGIDGLDTAKRIRAIDPRINIVIVTGYSDHLPGTIAKQVGPPDKLFYISKPFNPAEIQRLTLALTSKWEFEKRLEAVNQDLAGRCAELEMINADLAASEARASVLARHDIVADLPNRFALLEHLDRTIRFAHTSSSPCTLIYVDLDRFKEVNDTLGHNAGDELIRKVANRFKIIGGPSAFVARLGGDEFAVVCSHGEDPEALCRRLIGSFDQPFSISDNAVTVGASLGIASLDDDSFDVTELMRRADIALYASKNLGRGRFETFVDHMDDGIGLKHKLAQDLRSAMANDEMDLHYQPQVTADGCQISGLEALCRWQRADGSQVSPGTFIPIAEDSGLIRQLGEWVLRKAMSDAQRWPGMTVAINLSPVQFLRHDLAGTILAIAVEAKIDPRRIEFEITENVLIDDIGAALTSLTRLKDYGFRLALDDFGTGYSSLNYLRRFPFDKLKIDRSFILDIGGTAGSMKIVHSIVSLARALDLTVTAEGVETTEQHRLLRAAGCSQMQGYLFHRPMPAADIDALLIPSVAQSRSA